MEIRFMKIEDYDRVFKLWESIKNFSLRSLDDSKDGIWKFLDRNPDTSVVAEEDGMIVGTILCGHDGRRGTFYHVCVSEGHRKRGIGRKMTALAIGALRREGINKVSLIAFTYNELGNHFWQSLGWTHRKDLNSYDYALNEDNVVSIVK